MSADDKHEPAYKYDDDDDHSTGHYGVELDATMFANEEAEHGLDRAVGAFGRMDSDSSTSLFALNPASSEPTSVGGAVLGMAKLSMAGPAGHMGEEHSCVFRAAMKKPSVGVSSSSSSSAPVTFPGRPCFLVRTNFLATFDSAKDSTSVFHALDAILQSFSDFDFTFFSSPGEAMWKGKYIRSAKSCEVYVRVYADAEADGQYIIEPNRVKGDSKPFMAFYKEFKAAVTKAPVAKKATAFQSPFPCQPVTDEQFLTGIKSIFTMANEQCMEPRCEGVKMLCELASHETDLLRLEPCVSQVMCSLEMLVADEMDEVKQFAIMATSNFVNPEDLPVYKAKLVACGALLGELLNYSVDAPAPVYDSIQARRECAHILSVLSEHDAVGTLASLQRSVGATRVRQWLDSTVFVRDVRLKNYMTSARDNFVRQLSASQK